MAESKTKQSRAQKKPKPKTNSLFYSVQLTTTQNQCTQNVFKPTFKALTDKFSVACLTRSFELTNTPKPKPLLIAKGNLTLMPQLKKKKTPKITTKTKQTILFHLISQFYTKCCAEIHAHCQIIHHKQVMHYKSHLKLRKTGKPFHDFLPPFTMPETFEP